MTHSFAGSDAGSVVLEGTVIHYTGLEPVDLTGSAIDNLVLNLPDSTDDVVLEDDGVAGNGQSRIRSENGTFELFTFSNPTGSLTINAGAGDDSITIVGLDSGFSAVLAVNDGPGRKTVEVTGALNIGGLSLAAKTISVRGAVISGGAVDFKADNDLTFIAPVNVTAASAALTARAGRSIVLNSHLITTNAPIRLTANDTIADGIVDSNRDAGAAAITMAPGFTTLYTGNGDIVIVLGAGAGLSNSESGDITLTVVETTGNVLVVNEGPTPGSDILANSTIPNVIASSAAFDVNGAGGGGSIGAANGRISVSATNLEARSQSGGIFFQRNQQTPLIIGGAALGGLSGVSTIAGGSINFDPWNVPSTLTVLEPVSADGPGSVALAALGHITVLAAITSNTGAITLNGWAGVTLSGPDAAVTTGGTLAVDADFDGDGIGTYTQDDASSAVSASSVMINAARIVLNGTIAAPGQVVSLGSSKAGEGIDLGSISDSAANTLELSDAELDRINAAILRIGDSASGSINISAAISSANTPTLHLQTAGTLTGPAGVVAENLAIEAVGTVSLTTLGNNVASLAIRSTAGNVEYVNYGSVNFTGVDGVEGLSAINGALYVESYSGDMTFSNSAAVNDAEAMYALIADAPGRIFTMEAGARFAIGSGGTIYADRIDIEGNVTSPFFELRARSSGAAIDLGSATTRRPIRSSSPTPSLTESSPISCGSALPRARFALPRRSTRPPWARCDSSATVRSRSRRPISQGNLSIEAVGGVALTDPGNAFTTLAVYCSSGGVALTDVDGFTVGSVDGIPGIYAGNGTVGLRALSGGITIRGHLVHERHRFDRSGRHSARRCRRDVHVGEWFTYRIGGLVAVLYGRSHRPSRCALGRRRAGFRASRQRRQADQPRLDDRRGSRCS